MGFSGLMCRFCCVAALRAAAAAVAVASWWEDQDKALLSRRVCVCVRV